MITRNAQSTIKRTHTIGRSQPLASKAPTARATYGIFKEMLTAHSGLQPSLASMSPAYNAAPLGRRDFHVITRDTGRAHLQADKGLVNGWLMSY